VADEDAVSSAAYVLGLLTDEDVDWLASHDEHRTLEPGEVVVREGDPAPSIMLVLAGSLIATSSTTTLPDESRVRGDVIGITAVVDGGPSPWTVTPVSRQSRSSWRTRPCTQSSGSTSASPRGSTARWR
jgi:CRP-like cAMP-binding protein